jgi:hypothetical protein
VVNLSGSDQPALPNEERHEHRLVRSDGGWIPADPADDIAQRWFSR